MNGCLEQMYMELKESAYPVFIWGAGSMSEEVRRRLEEKKIRVYGKFIDINRLKSHILYESERLFTLEEIEKMDTKINVVMGHGHYEKRDEILKYKFVNKIYIIPNPYLQYAGPNIDYVNRNKQKIDSVMMKLADEKSQCALDRYIQVSLTNDINCLLKTDICTTGMYEFDPLKIGDNENFADIGAWEGDSIISFLKKTGNRYRHIYAVEPDLYSFEKLKNNMKGKGNISLFQCGLGKMEGNLCMEGDGTQSAYLSSKEINAADKTVEVHLMDNLFETKDISLIKIFVPFLFYDILKGGGTMYKKKQTASNY